MQRHPAPSIARDSPAETIALIAALAALWTVILASYAAWAGLLP